MVLGQKAGIFLHAIHAEGSIGGDMDAGIFGIVGVVAAAFDLSDTEAEDVLERC